MSLDLLSLTDCLTQANISERNSHQKLAENQLKEWERQPGFHQLLQTVYTDLSLPLQTRWLAIISFKNGVERYWRASKVNAISKEEKSAIRQHLFDLIDEPNKQLAIQNAQAISRVCRFDFPQEWPTMLDDIERILQQSLVENNNVKIHNMLIILNQVIKNLAMAKIGRTRPALQSKAPIITPLIIKIYTNFFNEWIENLDFGIVEIGYLSLKVMRRLITEVYDSPQQSPELTEFLSLSVRHFELLITGYEKYSPNDILEKYIKCYAKIYNLIVKSNPTSLVLLPCSKEILFLLLKIIQEKAQTVYNNDGDNDADGVWEFLAIKSLLIFKNLINFLFKKGAVLTLKSKSSKADVENAINLLTTQFFSEDLIKSLTDLLINYYIKLKPSDLESWANEPEEWANDEANQNFEFQIRQCAENFFQDLMVNFKDLLVPYVLNKVQNEMSNYNEVSVQNILVKDSVFSIFQLSANSIHEIIDFNDLCTRIFFPEALKNDMSEQRIIKRRVCLLINEWVGLSVITPATYQNIYNLLLNFLDPSNPISDTVVKLTAIQALKTIITDWDFKKDDFKPFIKDFTHHLLSLTTTMELTESKLFLLNTISDLIARTNPHISVNELDQLLNIVPKFWDDSNNSNELILKNSLLRILKNLVISLNTNTHTTWPIALPLIRVCCSPESEYHSLLSEDGYELWLAILQYYPASQRLDISNSLIQDLNDFYLHALMNQTEVLPLIIEIWRSYNILIPGLFIEDGTKEFVLGVFSTFAKYLPQMRDDALDILISYLEIALLENYNSAENFKKLLSLMMESRLLPTIIEMIMDDDQAHLTIAKLLLVLARIAYFMPGDLIEVFRYLFPGDSETSAALKKCITVWYARMDATVGNPRNRKIHVLGLTALLKTGNPVFFEDLSALVSLWISSLEEVNESANSGDCETYHSNYLYEFQFNDDLTVKENGEYVRFQELFKTRDPVHNLLIKQFINSTLNEVEQSIGQQTWAQLVSQLDHNLVENFQYFLRLPTNS
ncbi:Importin-11 [Cyberlindnera fabianii]|uniref:Importin-11 n=1 Tax=Cyberlindnera fabianii TaxID=36022 RepID=A0A1V2L441_CYBFA|nr:Importin-11 [Cyberlindnera fabianii]